MIARPIAHGVAVLVTLAATSALACSSRGYTLTSYARGRALAASLATIGIKAVRALNILNLWHAPPRCAITNLLQKVEHDSEQHNDASWRYPRLHRLRRASAGGTAPDRAVQ